MGAVFIGLCKGLVYKGGIMKMKKQGKKLATITMTLYEDRIEWDGMQPHHFTGQAEFIRAVNQLLAFCWARVQRPAETILGWKELCVCGGRMATAPRKKNEQVLPGVLRVVVPE